MPPVLSPFQRRAQLLRTPAVGRVPLTRWSDAARAACAALGLGVVLAVGALPTARANPAAAASASEPVRVVYHMSEGIPQASRAMNNIRNHLAADPTAKIVVVAHGLGIDFLLEGATNQMEQPFGPTIAELATRGVEFRVCNNTLVSRKIDASKVIKEAKVVPSGVAETARLQAKEGFVYLRP